ncbi:phosphate transporter [Auritidibacter sp. NML100628]|nr:phosphate transporter [Auritidibacter sp. NML100628]
MPSKQCVRSSSHSAKFWFGSPKPLSPDTVFFLILVSLLGASFLVMLSGHDNSNAIALPVRSGALTPFRALLLTAAMRVVGVILGALLIDFAVEEFCVHFPEGPLGLLGIAAALATALAWGILTWSRGVPSSSSHALTAGLLGAGLAMVLTGNHDIPWLAMGPTTWALLVSLVASPLAGGLLAWVLTFPALWLARDVNPSTVNPRARMTLAVTGAANALGHGIQYGARIYAITVVALPLAGLQVGTTWWIPVATAVCMVAGTFLGGWRIAHTLTERLVTIDPLRSSIASLTSAALLIGGAFGLQLPLSSSLTTAGAVVGAGHNQRHHSVRWPQAGRIGIYYVLTVVLCGATALLVTAGFSPLWD